MPLGLNIMGFGQRRFLSHLEMVLFTHNVKKIKGPNNIDGAFKGGFTMIVIVKRLGAKLLCSIT